jgi:hypothetical protein
MMILNPNQLYDSGNFAGKATRQLRNTDVDGTEGLRCLITTLKDIATADGTVATLATALGTVETELATAATFNKVVASF